MLSMMNSSDRRPSEAFEQLTISTSAPPPPREDNHKAFQLAKAAAAAALATNHNSSSSSSSSAVDEANNNGNTSSTSSTTSASNARREKRSTKSKCSPGLRSGKWTAEEESFTNMIIHYFKRGLLHIEDGTSLRWYLAKRLNCEAMRVTKKLKGNSSIGKQIFRALENNEENRTAIERAAQELAVVENLFLESLSASGGSHSSGSSANNTANSGVASSVTTTAPPFGTSFLVARAAKASPSHKHHKVSPSSSAIAARSAAAHKPSPAIEGVHVNSEDAKLLLNFFVGAHDATDSKKRVFHDVVEDEPSHLHHLSVEAAAASAAVSSSSSSPSPPSKRQYVKMEKLVS